MALWFLRAFFMLVCAGAGWQASRLIHFEDPFWGIIGGLAMFTIVLALEILLTGKESVGNLTAVVFGIAVGILFGHLAFYITTLVLPLDMVEDQRVTSAIRIILTVPLCYLTTMIVFRTRDRFRFVIPYVEFKKELKGPRALLLDSSAIIDGRILALGKAGLFETRLFLPDFVLAEIQKIADSADRQRRARGQRGLAMVNQLQNASSVDVSIYETEQANAGPVDAQLVELAREIDAHLCTTDANLTKVARARGVAVLNINELAFAVRPSVAPGEQLTLELIRRGDEAGQAVGFLDDGTLLVVENAESQIGNVVSVEIVRLLQKSSGRIVFGKLVS
jgi:uncharacterized protein YacL